MTRTPSPRPRAIRRSVLPWDDLRERREACDLTLRALGDLLGGVRDVTVWRWERGQLAPRPASLEALREILGDDLSDPPRCGS